MRARAQTSTRKTGTRPGATRNPARAPKHASALPKPGKPEVRIFVSYSHVDKEVRRRLETHLAPLKADNVTTWFDGDMDAGDKLDTKISRALREAHVFVGLISSDYLASHYCWSIEYKRAMNRRARGTMRVVAVVVRPCDWKSTPAAGFKLLPEDGRTLQEWRSVDAALLDVVRGIRRVVTTVRREMTAAAEPPKLGGALGKARSKATTKPSAGSKPTKSRARATTAPPRPRKARGKTP
ncbi:toll/interleukin-1 receptor domain-containing protein [Methylobacterium terrae]|uniref:Toll/interleukin-1 receptor domain-containing protein n=1 Tax=Methylobacterium terrae TaxID=2202827 RepID=A0A2U8WVI0_9HYPH|nr:toll/interleukin-1 receptor domain-containing protein [Methylobacterium terrae]AWN49460.1 toll/interleukin-1 receptor domain-containing protein [Methylobacterium terrae]